MIKRGPVKKTWKNSSWRSCYDVRGVPRYLRCMRCYNVVTHGMIDEFGGCLCGFRKLNPCLSLTWMEILQMKFGWFPLTQEEKDAINPNFPSLGRRVREVIL